MHDRQIGQWAMYAGTYICSINLIYRIGKVYLYKLHNNEQTNDPVAWLIAGCFCPC